MQIPMVVALWEHPVFQGVKRTLIQSNGDLQLTDFDDRTWAIGVHAGPNFDPTSALTVSFFPDPAFKGGKELVLGPGVYPNLQDLGDFGGTISSVRFNGSHARAPGVYERDQMVVELGPNMVPAAKIGPIPLVIRLYNQDVQQGAITEDPKTGAPLTGKYMTLVEDALDLGGMFGDEYRGKTTALLIQKGPDYDPRSEYFVRLYDEVQNEGQPESGGYHDFRPDDWMPEPPGAKVFPGFWPFLDGPYPHFDRRAKAVRILHAEDERQARIHPSIGVLTAPPAGA